MNKQLLLDLADHMETVHPSSYDQDSYFGHDDAEIHIPVSAYERVRVNKRFPKDWASVATYSFPEGACGTTACVLGHAPSVKSIRDAGLFLFSRQNARNGKITVWGGDVGIIENGELICNEEAARVVFKLTYDQGQALFGTSDEAFTRLLYTGDANGDFAEVTPMIVAKSIREFVANDGRISG